MTNGMAIQIQCEAAAPAATAAAECAGPWPRRRWVEAGLLHLVDAGLAAAIVASPFVLGGRIALGQLVVVVLALGVALAWCLRQCVVEEPLWRRSAAEPLLLAALALVVLQLLPLPPAAIEALSPQVYRVLPLWAPGAQPSLGTWRTLSLTPVATREAAILLTAFVLLFLVAAQRLRGVDDVERLLRWMALAAVAMAGFGWVQYLGSNGKYFWFFDYPYARTDEVITGSFTNRNHFAQFMALGIGPLVWWMFRLQGKATTAPGASGRFTTKPSRRGGGAGLAAVGLAVVAFAGLTSLSRGGAMAMLAAVLVALGVLGRASLLRHRSLAVLGGAGLLVAAGVAIYGYQALVERLDDFGSVEELDRGYGRRGLWCADLAAIADYPLVGAGLGSHREVAPMYFERKHVPEAREFTHAENGYVQVGLETGVLGLGLLLGMVGLCFWWCFVAARASESPRTVLGVAAVAGALAASLVHSLCDFVWYVPGCMVTATLAAACAHGLFQATRARQGRAPHCLRPPRIVWAGATCALVLLGAAMVTDTWSAVRAEPFWFDYLRLASRPTPADSAEKGARLGSMRAALAAVVERQPDHARAHVRLAEAHLSLFAQPDDPAVLPMDARQVREVVREARFDSGEAREAWLERAFGPRLEHLDAALAHAHRAVRFCPLLGEAYLHMAQLSFRQRERLPGVAAYLEQALRVRPFHGDTHFAAGQEAILAGDLDKALAHWRAAFESNRSYQEQLIRLLAERVPVAVLLEAFRPDPTALKQMVACYQQLNQHEALPILWRRYAEACEATAARTQGAAAAKHWLEAARAFEELNEPAPCERCLRAAIASDPFLYPARRALGACLYASRQWDEAERHLDWCFQQNRRDRHVREMLRAIRIGRGGEATAADEIGGASGNGRSFPRQLGASGSALPLGLASQADPGQ